tara:strand:+ start:125 stop:511 length:387 start_codon:yes stop_codon:yes gene_type:complete
MKQKKEAKKLQPGSAWEQFDLDSDGTVSDGELAMASKIEQLEHQRQMHENLDRMMDQQRMMAWVAMASMVLFTAAIFLPFVAESKVTTFSGILNTFYVSQAAVVGVFMGATAYSKSKNGNGNGNGNGK